VKTSRNLDDVGRVIVGVDTHLDEHVAVAIDHHAARLGEYRLATTAKGYEGLESWAIGLGEVATFGVEGTGSYGAGLARYLAQCGHTVIEVNRPDRSTRRRLGKSDPLDAEMAARSVLAGVARDSPKSGVDKVEMIRVLKIVKDSAMKARTQSMNQMKALVVTAPVELREDLAALDARRLVDRCCSFRPGRLATPAAAAKHALRLLARRHSQLTSEIEGVDEELVRLTAETAPALVNTFGVGADTAATLLVAAGSNPERLRSESAFAALCGVNPIPASSGKTDRHRLNRGGDRQANAALYRIVLVRLRHDERTREYMRRRTREGMTKPEIIRCLKRYVARQVFAILRDMGRSNLALPAAA
jgi:transposase